MLPYTTCVKYVADVSQILGIRVWEMRPLALGENEMRRPAEEGVVRKTLSGHF
jgi:hypothetical protein